MNCVCMHDSKSKSQTLLDVEVDNSIWHHMRKVDKLIKVKSQTFVVGSSHPHHLHSS